MDYLQKIWKAIKKEAGGKDLSGQELYLLPILDKDPFERGYLPDMDNVHIQREILREAAWDGNALAASRLARTYDGILVGRKWMSLANSGEAIKWYKKAVSMGKTDCMLNIAENYEWMGNRRAEIAWLQKGADEGLDEAFDKLIDYALGGVERFDEEGDQFVTDYPLTDGKKIPFPENHVAIDLMERSGSFKLMSRLYLGHARMARSRGDTELAKEYATKGFQYLEETYPFLEEDYRNYGALFELSMGGHGDRSDKVSLSDYKIVEKAYREGIGIPPDVEKAERVKEHISERFSELNPLSRGQDLMARAAETVALHNCSNNVEVASQPKFSMER